MLDQFWEYAEIYASMWKEKLHMQITYPNGEQVLCPQDNLLIVLNEMGKKGWELAISISKGRRSGDDDYSQILYLKRLASAKALPSSGPLRGTR